MCHTNSESDLVLHTRNLKNERPKSVFEYILTFWICVLVLWIHKGYFVLKKLVWNVFIKAIWYTNIYYVSELKSECKAANYNILDEASRSTESIATASNSTYLGHCDQSDTARHYSYTKLGKWKGSGWYRFTGGAGSRQSYLIY